MESIIRKTCAAVCLTGVAVALFSMSPLVIPAMGAIVAFHEVNTYAG